MLLELNQSSNAQNMKKQFLLMTFVCVQLTFLSAHDGSTRSNYLNRYSPIAIAEMQRSSIPASITLAQGILESAWGQGKLAARSNNHFGIKCKDGWTGNTVPYEDDDYDANGKLIKSCFRAYDDPYDSYRDHTDFLVHRERYAALFDLHPMDYIGWAKGLKACGYATAPDYAERLIRIIEENRLYLYDVNYIKADEAPIAEETTPQIDIIIDKSLRHPVDEEDKNEEYLDMVVPSKVNTSGSIQTVYTEIYTTNYTPEVNMETVQAEVEIMIETPQMDETTMMQIAKPVIAKPMISTYTSTPQTQVFAAPTFNIDRFWEQQNELNSSIKVQSRPTQREQPYQIPTSSSVVPIERLMNIPQRKDRTEQSKRGISLKTRLR